MSKQLETLRKCEIVDWNVTRVALVCKPKRPKVDASVIRLSKADNVADDGAEVLLFKSAGSGNGLEQAAGPAAASSVVSAAAMTPASIQTQASDPSDRQTFFERLKKALFGDNAGYEEEPAVRLQNGLYEYQSHLSRHLKDPSTSPAQKLSKFDKAAKVMRAHVTTCLGMDGMEKAALLDFDSEPEPASGQPDANVAAPGAAEEDEVTEQDKKELAEAIGASVGASVGAALEKGMAPLRDLMQATNVDSGVGVSEPTNANSEGENEATLGNSEGENNIQLTGRAVLNKAGKPGVAVVDTNEVVAMLKGIGAHVENQSQRLERLERGTARRQSDPTEASGKTTLQKGALDPADFVPVGNGLMQRLQEIRQNARYDN